MSGCCGTGPVIISGAPATPRVDVETVLLCDVQPDGTAVPVVVEPVYDTASGERVATRLVNPETGAPYTPTGTLGVCQPPAEEECVRQITTVRLCDDTTGDGIGDTEYVQLWAVDPCGGGAPELIGSYLPADFSTPYVPTSPVACPDAPEEDTPVVLGTVCVDDGAGGTLTAAVLKCQACTDTAVRYVDVATGAELTAPTVVPCSSPDVSRLLLCDTAADGTSTAFLRSYTVDGGSTTVTDTALDGTTPYTPSGTVGQCFPPSECASPTTPTATVGLCLADGTPIAVTVIRDCDGQVTSEGWLNLATGAWSAGAPPAGTVACGSSQSIQVSGTFCDVDAAGEVVGLVLVEYSYDADGAIQDVRLVDAVTGATYTPTGTVTVCPAGVEQPEQDIVQLCDTAADGTVTPLVRDYRRDETGAVVGFSDYTLDGNPYTPTGTVGNCEPQPERDLTVLCDTAADGTVTTFLRDYERDQAGAVTGHADYALDGTTPYTPTGTVATCGPQECETVAVQTLRLCDLNPDVTPDAQGRRCAVPFLRHLTFGCDGALISSTDTELDGSTPYTPVQAVDCGAGGVPAQVELAWPQTGIAEDPAGVSRVDFIYTVTNPETGDVAEVRLHASSSAGSGGCGGPYNPAAPVFNNPTTYTLTLDAAAQEMTVFRLDLVDLDTFEGVTGLNPPPDRVEGNVTWNGGSTITANANNVTAYAYWDNPPPQISYRYGNTGGGLACTAVAFQGTTLKAEGCCGCEPEQPEACTKQIIERCACDDTTGDGVGDVQYTELWAVDPCGEEEPVLLGTYEDGDLTRPYTPTAPVECTVDETPPAPLNTGVRNVTGTAVQNIAGGFPTLQSVSLTVLAGVVNATMASGANVPIPAGVTMTWSVAKDEDAALTAASFTGASAAANYLLNWTYR